MEKNINQKDYAVAWYPGEFGNLFRVALYIESSNKNNYSSAINNKKADSHIKEANNIEQFHSENIEKEKNKLKN